jgi:hypothetical protein
LHLDFEVLDEGCLLDEFPDDPGDRRIALPVIGFCVVSVPTG